MVKRLTSYWPLYIGLFFFSGGMAAALLSFHETPLFFIDSGSVVLVFGSILTGAAIVSQRKELDALFITLYEGRGENFQNYIRNINYYMKIVFSASLIGIVSGIIQLFQNINDPSAIGPGAAFSLMSLFNGLFIVVIILLPMRIGITIKSLNYIPKTLPGRISIVPVVGLFSIAVTLIASHLMAAYSFYEIILYPLGFCVLLLFITASIFMSNTQGIIIPWVKYLFTDSYDEKASKVFSELSGLFMAASIGSGALASLVFVVLNITALNQMEHIPILFARSFLPLLYGLAMGLLAFYPLKKRVEFKDDRK